MTPCPPKRGMTLRAGLLLAGLLLLIMTTACGKKGPVRPKLATPAAAPAELSLQQQGNLFVLGWSMPPTARGGREVQDVSGFRIKRLVYDAPESCPTCRDPQTIVADLDADYPSPAQRIGARFYWRDSDLRPGNGYRYAVVAVAPGGVEGPAAMIHLTVQEPPPPPTDLRVEAGDERVMVTWNAPELPAGVELVGYNLYRRQAGRPFPIVALNAGPLREPGLVDRGLENGLAYEYRVSALVRSGDQLLESLAGPGVLITPQAGR